VFVRTGFSCLVLQPDTGVRILQQRRRSPFAMRRERQMARDLLVGHRLACFWPPIRRSLEIHIPDREQAIAILQSAMTPLQRQSWLLALSATDMLDEMRQQDVADKMESHAVLCHALLPAASDPSASEKSFTTYFYTRSGFPMFCALGGVFVYGSEPRPF